MDLGKLFFCKPSHMTYYHRENDVKSFYTIIKTKKKNEKEMEKKESYFII